MDIVDRLNLFLERARISKSQFADKCSIPRPTASQILSGRNKKVSDEIIAKIHLIYPNLSIMWLMFGEGSMFLDEHFAAENKLTENSIFDVESDILSKYDKETHAIQSEKINNTADIQPVYDKPRSEKQITKIVVFYSDNSFEEFFK